MFLISAQVTVSAIAQEISQLWTNKVKSDRRGIFGNRSSLDYFGMYLTSRSAFQVASVGLIWIVFAVTKSALDVAIVGIANTVSTVIFTLPAGVWIDRLNRHVLLLVSNVVSVACLVLLTILTISQSFELVVVVIIVAVWAAAGELYRSTHFAILPDIVNANELTSANGVTQSGYQIVNSISTVLGGGLIVIAGAALAFVYGVVGYGLAALFCGFLVYRFRGTRLQATPEAQAKRNMGRDRGRISLASHSAGAIGSLAAGSGFQLSFWDTDVFSGNLRDERTRSWRASLRWHTSHIRSGGAGGSLLAGRMPNAVAYTGKITILLWGAVGGSLLALLGLLPSAGIALGAVLGIGLALGFGNNIWLTSAQNLCTHHNARPLLCDRRTIELRRWSSIDCRRRHPNHHNRSISCL